MEHGTGTGEGKEHPLGEKMGWLTAGAKKEIWNKPDLERWGLPVRLVGHRPQGCPRRAPELWLHVVIVTSQVP